MILAGFLCGLPRQGDKKYKAFDALPDQKDRMVTRQNGDETEWGRFACQKSTGKVNALQ